MDFSFLCFSNDRIFKASKLNKIYTIQSLQKIYDSIITKNKYVNYIIM